MKKSIIIICGVLCVCALMVCVYATTTLTDENQNTYFIAGQFYKQAHKNTEENNTNSETVLAKYNGTSITSGMVEYHRNMNILRSEATASKNNTNENIINSIIQSLIILEEAEHLGLSATDEEVVALVENAIQAYSIPEGKKMMDDFCSGAGMTFEEYLEIYREQLPRSIARQKLLDAVGKQFCEENGLVFTKVNPPAEMVAAQEAYIEELFKKNSYKIEYFISVDVVS